MYQSVRDRFVAFTTTFEGRVSWMYVDVKGLVTTGIGNLIDSVDAAAELPWQHKGGGAATRDEVAKAWNDLKANRVALGKAGYKACESRNDLRLSDAAIGTLVGTKLDSNAATFAKSFPDFASWPADAQLAAMSMSWALGPAFAPKWPSLTAALKGKNFTSAAANCKISETGNPGVVPRNVADVKLFTNAAAVAASSADPSALYYPGSPPSGPPSTGGSGSGGSGSMHTGSGGSSGTGTGGSTGGTGPGGTGDTTDTGDTGSGDTTDTGDTGSGDTTDTGDTGSGDTTDTGDTGSGDTTDTGDTGSGDTTDTGDTGSGDTGSGDTGSGDTGSGDTGSGDTGSGDTGDTGSGDTGDSGGSAPDDSGSGDSGGGDSGDGSSDESSPEGG